MTAQQVPDIRLIVLLCGEEVYLFRPDQAAIADLQQMALDVAYPALETTRLRRTRTQIEEAIRTARTRHPVNVIDVT